MRWLGIVSILGMACASAQERPELVRVDLDTAKQLYDEEVFLLDVRTPEEFEAGHLPGAQLIPVSDLSERIGEISGSKDASLLVYCASGGRSQRAATALAAAGFSKVSEMKDGFNGWSAAGLPSETGPMEAAVTEGAAAEAEGITVETVATEEESEAKGRSLFGCAATTPGGGTPNASVPVLLAAALLGFARQRKRTY